MNKTFVWSFSVALAGFLFGFDTIVISGVDKELQAAWESSDIFHGFVVMAMALWGTVLGAMLGGVPANKYGRKNTLIGIGALFFISAIGSAFANDPYTFSFFRFIGGIGVGASTIAAPAYISEIVPTSKRGRFVAMFQLSIVVGVLGALTSNYFLSNVGEQAWRWMLGAEALPAFIYLLAMLFVPQSPRWLITKGRAQEAKKVLSLLNREDSEGLITESVAKNDETIFMKKYRKPLLLVLFIAMFNQFSGINAVLYYAPRIFEEAGLARGSSLLSSVGIGLVNLLFTLAGMTLIDRFGRKLLMYIGSIGYIFSLSMVALSFILDWEGILVTAFIFVFIASHAIGQGTVIWVFIAELFPTHLRASGQALGSSAHWVLAALIPSFIPLLFTSIGAGAVFICFATMMVLQLIWVKVKMPETKGVPLEDLSKKLAQ